MIPSPQEQTPSLGSLSLYQIEDDLMQLLALAEDPELDPEAKGAIDHEISKYFLAQVRKVDGIAGAVRKCRSAATEVRAEILRLQAIQDAWEARERRIKENAMYAMKTHGVKVLETAKNKLRIQGNGGLQPLDVFSEVEVPDEHKNVTLKFSAADYRKLWPHIVNMALSPIEKTVEVDGTRLRAALKLAPVNGARLLERSEHLRVE
jgi:hypothetical protein